jgi:hypothetical protein
MIAFMDLATLALLISVVSTVISFIAYRHAKSVKATDLRIELGKVINEVELEIADLPRLLAHVDKSHGRVLSMRGLHNSGAAEVWRREHEAGQQTLAELISTAAKRVDFSGLSNDDLEKRIVAAHAWMSRARRLRDKYQSVLDEDDEHRREKRAQMMNNPSEITRS